MIKDCQYLHVDVVKSTEFGAGVHESEQPIRECRYPDGIKSFTNMTCDPNQPCPLEQENMKKQC
jgi:hypothetical protein